MGKKQSTGKSQPKPKNNGGTYMAFSSGRVGRTYGNYGLYESMDTTGYAKGKKTFDLMESTSGTKPRVVKKVTRAEVPAVISKLKKGATRTINTTSKKSK